MSEAVIIDAVRSARGKKKNGALNHTHPMDLAAMVLQAAVRRTGISPEQIDDVTLGCVTQVGEQGLNIARGAVLAAGLPIEVAGYSLNRFCGSGLQAVNSAAQAVMSGTADL
ncbi:MAG: acetyl-CoA C-acyltransferase, partial [Myxococcales bacterium]